MARSFRRRLAQGQIWVRKRVPPGLRLVLGLLLMVGGVFGFLPVLGFWMLPLGVAVAALDVVPLWRRIAGGGSGRGGGRDGERGSGR